MRMAMNQRGVSLIGFVIVMAVVGFALFIGAKLFPMYTEYMAVKASMMKVRNSIGSARMSPDQVWNILERNFDIEYIESVKRTDVQLVRKNGNFLRIAYEVRKPLVYNLDVVAKFDHTVELTRSGEE